VIHDLGHPLDRKQGAPIPRMARLAARLRPVPRDRPRLPSQGGSWLGDSDELRESLRPLLELLDPLRQRGQLSILGFQPCRQRRQRLHDRLASRRVDRLRLRALHTGSFAAPNRVPAD
jgi:hypothetical protein